MIPPRRRERSGTRAAAVALLAAMALVTCAPDQSDPASLNPSTALSSDATTAQRLPGRGPHAPTTPEPPGGPAAGVAPYLDPGLPVATRVGDLLSRMSVEDKVGQMTQVALGSIGLDEIGELGIGSIVNGGNGTAPENTPGGWADMIDDLQVAALESRLRVPLLYAVDAIHGFGNLYGATVFPHHIGLGAAATPWLVERIGRATAVELAAVGARWNLAPTLASAEDIRWGRTYESFGEHASAVAELGAAEIRGLQEVPGSSPLQAEADVVATAKHYIGDGATKWGTSTDGNSIIDQGDAIMTEEQLRARLLPPYEAAIAGGVGSVMVSFSSWNGAKLHAHRYLLTDVLKGELGFDGVLLSDWGGIDRLPGDYDSDVVRAVNAGIDMVMVPHEHERFRSTLLAAVERGDVEMTRIDDAVRRILTVKFEAGLFEQPFAARELLERVGSAEHRELAADAVRRSAVLLRNEEATIPLDPSVGPILVAGAGADDIGLQSGGWTIDHQGATGPITVGSTVLDGIAAVGGDRVVHDPSGEFTHRLGERAPLGIVVLAEQPYAEGLGDRADLRLPAADLEVLNRVRVQVDRLVVVLLSGRPLVVTDQLPAWDALVAGWLPGSEGAALADVLFGRARFTGRLPFSWPRSNEQLGLREWKAATGCDGPLFPVGYGLHNTSGTVAPPLLACPD